MDRGAKSPNPNGIVRESRREDDRDASLALNPSGHELPD